jgi:transcription elongation factor GreB
VAGGRSPYITRNGYERLRTEQQQLWQRRRLVVQALAAAAAEGDRSENAEYIYRKKELRELDRRLRYLQRRIPELKVVEAVPSDQDTIFFGAWIELEDEAGNTCSYRIVGADEFDPGQGWISVDAPVARALLRRRLDEEVEVATPGGIARYLILDIRYGERTPE